MCIYTFMYGSIPLAKHSKACCATSQIVATAFGVISTRCRRTAAMVTPCTLTCSDSCHAEVSMPTTSALNLLHKQQWSGSCSSCSQAPFRAKKLTID